MDFCGQEHVGRRTSIRTKRVPCPRPPYGHGRLGQGLWAGVGRAHPRSIDSLMAPVACPCMLAGTFKAAEPAGCILLLEGILGVRMDLLGATA